MAKSFIKSDGHRDVVLRILSQAASDACERREELTERSHSVLLYFCDYANKNPVVIDYGLFRTSHHDCLAELIKIYESSINWHFLEFNKIVHLKDEDLKGKDIPWLEAEKGRIKKLKEESVMLIKQYRETGSRGSELSGQLGFSEVGSNGLISSEALKRSENFTMLSSRTFFFQKAWLKKANWYLFLLDREINQRSS